MCLSILFQPYITLLPHPIQNVYTVRGADLVEQTTSPVVLRAAFGPKLQTHSIRFLGSNRVHPFAIHPIPTIIFHLIPAIWMDIPRRVLAETSEFPYARLFRAACNTGMILS